MCWACELLEVLDTVDADAVRELEPRELAALCRNPVFRALCTYCKAGDLARYADDESRFDADEMGIDPEEE